MVYTHCMSYILGLSSCPCSPPLFWLRAELPSLVPDVKTSPTQVYISLVNLSVDAKSRADMSSRHCTLCTLRHRTKAIQEIYLLRGKRTALLFSCKCLFLWDLAGFLGVNHGCLSHFTGGGFFFFNTDSISFSP